MQRNLEHCRGCVPSGVDKLEVCSFQYFDSLFAYSSLGCFEMLSSGRSIFHCSSWGQVEELNVLMQLSIGLYFISFISIAVLRLGLNGSVDSDAVFNFLLHCRKIETMSKSSGAVHFVSRLRWIWSSKLQFSCGWSLHCVFDMTDCCCFWKMVLCWFGLLGRFAWSKLICCFNAEYRWAFLRLSFLAGGASWQDSGCSVESIRVVWSVFPAWEAVELTLGGCLHLPVRGPRPYRFGSDNRGCSRTNAWQFSTFPRRRLPAFLSEASTCVRLRGMTIHNDM